MYKILLILIVFSIPTKANAQMGMIGYMQSSAAQSSASAARNENKKLKEELDELRKRMDVLEKACASKTTQPKEQTDDKD